VGVASSGRGAKGVDGQKPQACVGALATASAQLKQHKGESDPDRLFRQALHETGKSGDVIQAAGYSGQAVPVKQGFRVPLRQGDSTFPDYRLKDGSGNRQNRNNPHPKEANRLGKSNKRFICCNRPFRHNAFS
jgi:hypothetical protein